MAHAYEFDPWEVLGVPSSARLLEIREAYRAQSKKHHPDTGGDAWAFRLVSRSYEILCCTRVAGRMQEEERNEPPPTSRADPGPRGPTPTTDRPEKAKSDEAFERVGVRDTGYSEDRLVAVELLLLRHEIDHPVEFLLSSRADRNLSCSLNVIWPRPDAHVDLNSRAASVKALADAFKRAAKARKPTRSHTETVENGFRGWLSYPTAEQTFGAFQSLREALNARGFGVIQTTREMTIPRGWSRV